MKFRRCSVKPARVGLVPMIDIVFQLILFFLVSTAFSSLPGIRLQLPSSVTSENVISAGMVITVGADGGLWLNGHAVAPDGLGEELASYDTGGAERNTYPVRLESDKMTANGIIVDVFDMLRLNGFSAVTLRTVE